jgi:hypothetical protein
VQAPQWPIFKAAAIATGSIFLFDDAIDHVRELKVAGNLALGNMGVPLYMVGICPLLAIAFD